MPIFEYRCSDCGKTYEIITAGTNETPVCRYCNSTRVEKMLSAPAASSGVAGNRMPGPGDTACCGMSPGQASGCAGPGSCCGRNTV